MRTENIFTTTGLSIFPKTQMDPRDLVDAVMRGQEDIVLNILKANPSYLLKKAKIKNSVNAEYEVTPLQAAVITGDVQMIERMKEHFARLTIDLKGNPINGLNEMYHQIKIIYKESLETYCHIQRAEIERLNLEKKDGQEVDHHILRENKRLEVYADALKSDDLEKIIAAHDQAQIDHTFDFQPYVQAICSIDFNDPLQKQEFYDVMALITANNDQETQAAIAKGVSHIEIGFTDQDGRTHAREEVQEMPFCELTLLQKMNRFREKLVEHRQQEIISNPHHILKISQLNDYINLEVRAGRVKEDGNRTLKRAIIFCQLLGMAQITSEEALRQDLRQRTICLVKTDATHDRSTTHEGRLCPADLSSKQGWGYQFALGDGSYTNWKIGPMRAQAPAEETFKILMSKEKSKLLTLIADLVQKSNQESSPVQP